jgi:hypothetical protein
MVDKWISLMNPKIQCFQTFRKQTLDIYIARQSNKTYREKLIVMGNVNK